MRPTPEVSTWYWPIETSTSSLAIGWVSVHCQWLRVPEPSGRGRVGSPFDPTSRPAGTSTEMEYVALSLGVSLLGKPVIEPIGWVMNVAPSEVGIQPSSEPSVSCRVTGVPPYSTTTVNKPLTGVAGVTTSLCLPGLAPSGSSIRLKVAAATPLTCTDVTASP